MRGAGDLLHAVAAREFQLLELRFLHLLGVGQNGFILEDFQAALELRVLLMMSAVFLVGSKQ